tara:strand:- start:653 stop:1267 length:615 start_codon:yes stop_codon:yes gene_type:complete
MKEKKWLQHLRNFDQVPKILFVGTLTGGVFLFSYNLFGPRSMRDGDWVGVFFCTASALLVSYWAFFGFRTKKEKGSDQSVELMREGLGAIGKFLGSLLEKVIEAIMPLCVAVAIYFGAQWLMEYWIMSTLEDMIEDRVGEELEVTKMKVNGIFLWDNRRTGKAYVSRKGETIKLPIKIKGYGFLGVRIEMDPNPLRQAGARIKR